MQIVKYDKKNKGAKCKCGGQIMFDGSIKYRLPIGFGFAPNQSKFQVDFVEMRGWHGFCLECNKETLAETHKRKAVSKYPKGINKRIGKTLEKVG